VRPRRGLLSIYFGYKKKEEKVKREVLDFVERVGDKGLQSYLRMRYIDPYKPPDGVDFDIARSDANRSRMESKRVDRKNATWSWIKDSYSHGPLGIE
jgi:ribulose bisphosphate carboxylase small subunit